MLYKLSGSKPFTAAFTESKIADGLTVLHITAESGSKAEKLELALEWFAEDIGVNACWNPSGYRNKSIQPKWGGYSGSNATRSAPVFCNVAYDDTNRLTIACSDAKNSVRIRSCIIEETSQLANTVLINVDCAVSEYTADVRIDTRAIPFSKCVADAVKWWESYDGYEPINVPDSAQMPLYSTWYSFHQQVDSEEISDECRYFSKLGCKVLIVDDGWQMENSERSYAYCGDWKPAKSEIPDMKKFVDAVHETGMKFVLWYSVPFIGEKSNAFDRFAGKYLSGPHNGTYTVDPRYPEVREYLINTYRNAVIDWGIDGFKLDFVDSFVQNGEVKEGMDCISVYDAVDRLMKDIIRELTRLDPDILIEFRQSYIGPLMRTFGNMFRSADCANDSLTNRLNTLALRLTSGNTAVHSDMVMWNYGETAEQAAFQLTNVLFSVPQISVRYEKMPESHAKMVKTYLDFWMKYRTVLLNGEMLYKNYASDYTYVSACKDGVQVGAVYAGRIAYVEVPTDEIVFVNASLNKEIIIDAPMFSGEYSCTVNDCMGNIVCSGTVSLNSNLTVIKVPVNGTATLKK